MNENEWCARLLLDEELLTCSASACGVYVRLAARAALTGDLPAAPKLLAALSYVSVKQFNRVWPEIQNRFESAGDGRLRLRVSQTSPKSCPNVAQTSPERRPNVAQTLPKRCPNVAQKLPKSFPNVVQTSPLARARDPDSDPDSVEVSITSAHIHPPDRACARVCVVKTLDVGHRYTADEHAEFFEQVQRVWPPGARPQPWKLQEMDALRGAIERNDLSPVMDGIAAYARWCADERVAGTRFVCAFHRWLREEQFRLDWNRRSDDSNEDDMADVKRRLTERGIDV